VQWTERNVSLQKTVEKRVYLLRNTRARKELSEGGNYARRNKTDVYVLRETV
jgi:hypothetical protein